MSTGVLDSTDTPLQYYQQSPADHLSPDGKVDFHVSGGLQFLEFEGTDVVKVEPVFSFGVSYQPFPATSIGLLGYRNIKGSSWNPDRTMPPPASNSRCSNGCFKNLLRGSTWATKMIHILEQRQRRPRSVSMTMSICVRG